VKKCVRSSAWAALGLAATLTACGNRGSGGSGYGSPASSPAPAISFSQPAEAITINLGQAVSVAWTATNATSCNASTSASGGGAFTGSLTLMGTQQIVPTAPGTYSYTITCAGDGNSSATTPTVTVQPNLLSILTPPGSIAIIGSTIDPINGDQNPYGLTIAPATAGLITKGDLVVCNFNDGPTNTQGNGTTIVGLHATAGATPYRIAQSPSLRGCDAITMLPDDSISSAAWATAQNPLGENPLVSPTGAVATPFAADKLTGPWGEAYVAATSTQPAALYISNAPGGTNHAGGTIDRISLKGDAQTSFTEIVTGFCSSGAPGGIFGPAGLTYDPAIDTLYIVDTSSASVVAISGVSSIGTDGIVVNGTCSGTATPTAPLTFSGPSMSAARVIAHGPPFNTPLSAALLKNGDLVVGNADIGLSAPSATTNLLIEISPVLPGGFVGQPLQIDTGTPGALFGIAATVDDQGNQIIYFNDDNAAAVMQLGPAASSGG
jgi:hypothetical protein